MINFNSSKGSDCAPCDDGFVEFFEDGFIQTCVACDLSVCAAQKQFPCERANECGRCLVGFVEPTRMSMLFASDTVCSPCH